MSSATVCPSVPASNEDVSRSGVGKVRPWPLSTGGHD